MAKILVVDDSESQRKIMTDILTAQGHEILYSQDVDEALKQIQRELPEVVLTDLKMPGKTGFHLVEEVLKMANAPEVIMITAFGSIDTAIKAVRMGVYDYLEKPVKPEELFFLIEKAQEKFLLKQESERLRRELSKELKASLVAKSKVMQELIENIEKVAVSEATVLIRGETGTGKECVARLIHLRSSRIGKPLQSINCAAVAETLQDSELFGYEKGSFTGAQSRKIGIIEAASGGTLFLDEIGDMSLGTQAKILRVLQEKKIRRVGGTEDISIDVRVLAATNKNLEEAIAEGRFRADLFYRLNVVPIRVPPLRERTEDIPELAFHLLQKFSKNKTITLDAMSVLKRYPWPGNVRELESVLERIAVFLSRETIEANDLHQVLRSNQQCATTTTWELPEKGIVFDDWERNILGQALEKTNGNMAAAAKFLGMTYRTFRYRAISYGLKEE